MERHELAALLTRFGQGTTTGNALIDDPNPAKFMASVAGAASADGNVFLGNPAWTARERADAGRILDGGPSDDLGWLMIPSGGSSGQVKFARHDGWTIAAAVEGFRRHFGMERVNSISVLPLHHVAGFMAWMRSAITGGSFVTWAWKDLEAGHFPGGVPSGCCISLVPTQLQRLLASQAAVAWLRQFSVIFIGGGPTWDGLLGAAASLELPLSPSYGATETAAMVAALRPREFLGGMRGCGRALPHARIDIDEGIVRIGGESIFRGYYPGVSGERSWTTQDLGGFDTDGNLVIYGRSDDLVITGGNKVSPAEVEAALRSSGQFDDVAVVGVADPEWGHVVVACHPVGTRPPRMELVALALSGLAAFKHPRSYAALSPWPRNSQGKIDRVVLARLAAVSPRQSSPKAP
jgi:O-succinylbenzoic acid--CoA ligase